MTDYLELPSKYDKDIIMCLIIKAYILYIKVNIYYRNM